MPDHGRPPIVDVRARLGEARRGVRRSRLPREIKRMARREAAGDVGSHRLPEALVPDGLVRQDPTGARARDRLLPGEAVHSARLAIGTGTTAALLPAGRVAITLSHDGAALEPDDRIDLHDGLTGARLARDARVLGADDTRFTAAVDRREIVGVVRALTTGGVVPVVTG